LLRRVGRFGVHHHLRAGGAGERKLFLGDVEGRNVQAHGLGILYGQLAEAADPGDRDPLSGLRLGFLDAFIVVTPAQRIGAISAKSELSGKRPTYGAAPMTYSAKLPLTL